MHIELQESGAAQSAAAIDVALFKEVVSRSRVVADSSKFLVYALKNQTTLRVLTRANNVQGAFKQHKNDVELAKFVNYKSNVIATAAKDEFLVWFITTDEKSTAVETKIYFSLTDQVTIRSFSWFLDSKTRTPELLVLYGTTAAQFNSSRLITEYQGSPIDATLAACALPFERAVTAEANLTAVGADEIFAFSIDAISVAVCTARHGNAPAWRPCDGLVLTALEVLQDRPPTLVASCTEFATIWSVDGEPQRLYKLTVGCPLAIVLSCQNTIALFSANKEVFLVEVSNKKITSTTRTVFTLQVPSSARSVTFNATEHGFASTADFSSRLCIHTMKRALLPSPTSPGAAAKTLPSPMAVGTTSVSPSVVDPAIVAAGSSVPPQAALPLPRSTGGSTRTQQQQPLSPALPPPPTYAASVMVSPPIPPQPTPPPIRVPLLNSSLPQLSQDGQIAQALEAAQAELADLKNKLDNGVQNTAQILQLVPQMVKRDHSSLITLSLEAQMTELQNAIKAGELGLGGAGSAGNASTPGFESHLMATLMDDVAKRLVEGLVPGIRDAFLNDLEPSLRQAVVNHLKKSQKDVFKARVDALLRNAAGEFAAELDRKQKVYEKQFENYGKEVRRVTEGALTKMLQQISSLEDQLIAIHTSGVIDEVKQLRSEVQALRAAAAATQTAETVLSPATIVATAKSMIESKECERALDYVVRLNQSDVTVELLDDIGRDDSLRDQVLQVQNPTLWGNILTHLASVTRSGQLSVALQWIKDIVTDHEGSVKNLAVKHALQVFVGTWKQASLEASLAKELRIVEKIVRA